jgi:hypothetical protein
MIVQRGPGCAFFPNLTNRNKLLVSIGTSTNSQIFAHVQTLKTKKKKPIKIVCRLLNKKHSLKHRLDLGISIEKTLGFKSMDDSITN